MSRVDPLSLLREYFSQNKKIKSEGKNLIFGKVSLAMDTPTAYKPQNQDKRYNLGDLWLFLNYHVGESAQKKEYYSAISQYKKDNGPNSVQIVSAPHQNDIIKYFSGQSDFTENIDDNLREDV